MMYSEASVKFHLLPFIEMNEGQAESYQKTCNDVFSVYACILPCAVKVYINYLGADGCLCLDILYDVNSESS